MQIGNKHKVFGIATDIVTRDSKVMLDKNGNRIYGAIGWYRIINPLAKLGAEYSIGFGVSRTPESAMTLKSKGDIWFMKIADNEDIDYIYGTNKEFTGAKIVLDLDDDPDHVNIDHPDYKQLEERKHMRLRMIKLADHVVVSTEQIKQAIKHINPYITVIPNAIDPKIWKVKKNKRTDGKIRIGWMSSGSHFADLPIIKQVMNDIVSKYPNVEFHFAGMRWEEMEAKGFKHHIGTIGYKAFPQFYADLDIDIAIAPLKDTQFNRCKSNIKYLEASMLEIPTVASDVIPYQCIQHGKTGYLASTPAQFTKYLSWLIENPEKRKEIGKEAKKYTLDNWTIDKFLPLYEDLFNKINTKVDISVVTSIVGGKDSLKPQKEYPGVEYVAFLDEDTKDERWKIRKAYNKFVEPVMNAKIHKLLTHKYVDNEYIVWMDGNVSLKQDPHELVKLMGDKDFAFFTHPGRNCIYKEAEMCIQLNKGKIEEIGEQIKEYTHPKNKFPLDAGLCELTCFIRKNNKKTNDLFEKWWAEVCRFSERDQISFPVIFKGQKWAVIPGTIAKAGDFNGTTKELRASFPGNDYFKFHKHVK